MKFYGKAESAAKAILSAFERGNLPQALATIFVRRKDDRPSSKWSWANQLICAVHGCQDARAFGQWQDVGRSVRKGEHAQAIILAPCTRKETVKGDDGREQDRIRVYGFRGVPIFDIAQTEGEPVTSGLDPDTAAWLLSLPLRDVAEAWGIAVDTFNGEGAKYRGFYRHGGTNKAIALGVQNIVVWAHELVHAADDKLGSLVERGQHWRSETVAQLGASTLLVCLGYDVEADLGMTWEYVSAYARAAEIEPLTACMQVLKRACDAVALILDTAEQIQALKIDGVTADEYAAIAERIELVA